jgi:2-polyprenyl-3-methyl-5-hydroxy-6-metoxy-1,4-benzoquinol methylase
MALSSNAEQVRTEEVPCPWCGETECRPLFSTEDLISGEGEFVVARCPECGLIYTRVRPRPEDLGHFYPSTYYTGMAAPGRATSSNWQSRFREASLRVIFGYPCGGLVSTPSRVMSLVASWVTWGLRRDASWVPWMEGGRLLEVGAARGSVLQAYVQLGWDGMGVEISDTAASMARQAGLDVRTGTLEEVNLPSASFDAVIFNHVLEHVPRPRETLLEAARVLRPGGWLLVRVPNAASLETHLYGRYWRAWEVPRHLTHFTPPTLMRALEASGFDLVRLRSECRFGDWGSALTWALQQRFHVSSPSRVGSAALAPVALLSAWAHRGPSLAALAKRSGSR